MNLLLFFILLLNSSFSSDDINFKDSSIKKKDAPSFLIKATPRGKNIDDVEYFLKKFSNGSVTYELKYEDNDEEVSVSYSSDGKFLEKEEDTKFSALPDLVRKKIEDHLDQKFEKYKIQETEIRTTKELKKLIDVEVFHSRKPTGLSEISFTFEGTFVSEEIEDVPSIETLN